MFFKVENSSHRPLLEWKYSPIVMRFSSYVGPIAANQTCCLWLIHTYERLSMIYNSVITRKYYQIGVRHRCISTSQYFRSLAAKSLRELDTLMLFYDFISYCIIYYVVCMRSEQKLKCTEIAHRNCMLWTDFPYLRSMPYSWARESFEFEESYIMGRLMPWCRSCRKFKCQFATGESEPWDLWQHVSAYPSICLNGILRHLDIFGKREPSTRFKPQNSMLHGARLPHLYVDDLW